MTLSTLRSWQPCFFKPKVNPPGSQELVHVKGTYFWRNEYQYTLLSKQLYWKGYHIDLINLHFP